MNFSDIVPAQSDIVVVFVDEKIFRREIDICIVMIFISYLCMTFDYFFKVLNYQYIDYK